MDETGVTQSYDETGSVRWCRTMDAMERYGGSFVSALARAWRCADDENHERLMIAFRHYYDEYAALGRFTPTANGRER